MACRGVVADVDCLQYEVVDRARLLAATGVTGCPREYFLAEDPAKLPDYWRFWEEGPYAAGHDVSDRVSPAGAGCTTSSG